MLRLTIIATLLTTILAFAIPQADCNETTTGGVNPPFPARIEVSYYQGAVFVDTDSCGLEVANGTIEAEYCNSICTAGISIAQTPNNHCTFTLYTGSPSCSANDGGEKVTHPIPAGEGSVCVSTGVEDGCNFQSASGVWSCR